MTLAYYLRLSTEDCDVRTGQAPESMSIVNQRRLLDAYLLERAEFQGAQRLEFVDDGYSGTNFRRPGVTRLWELVRGRGVDCILVKDFSRLGRNYLEVGEYLEEVLPFLGVRFISVNDRYDSAERIYGTAGELALGVRNLANEYYSRDLSRRVKTALRQYAARGECITGRPLYGYRKDGENRRMLRPDGDAAETVRRIFRLWLEGLSVLDLTRLLNAEGAATPARCKAGADGGVWYPSTVRRILHEEQYTGTLIAQRRMNNAIRHTAPFPAPREAWTVAKGAFEPLVSGEVFRAAQSRFSTQLRGTVEKAERDFSCRLRCGICGKGLYRHKKKRIYYSCDAGRWSGQSCCGQVRLREEAFQEALACSARLYSAVLEGAHTETHSASPRAPGRRGGGAERGLPDRDHDRKSAFLRLQTGEIGPEEFRSICEGLARKEGQALKARAEKDEEARTEPRACRLTQMVSARVFPGGRAELIWDTADPFVE